MSSHNGLWVLGNVPGDWERFLGSSEGPLCPFKVYFPKRKAPVMRS